MDNILPIGVIFAIICAIAGGFYNAGKENVREEAIKAGVAHYVADPTKPEAEFQWITKEGK